MSIKLKELGFTPYMVGTNYKQREIDFLKKYTNCRIIKTNFSEINQKEYDYLMVNSDQTWRKFSKIHFYDIGFLKFAKNWNIPKFVYRASLGYSDWRLTKQDDYIAKDLLKNFTGISIREKGSVDLVKIHFGIKPIYVIDPTLLIDKYYYLKIIRIFKYKKEYNGLYIFTYILKKEKKILNFIEYSSKNLKYKIYNVKLGEKNSIEKFIYGIKNSKAVITNSYHGTLFSIIFNKPFISFISKNSARERFYSLQKTLDIKDRILENNKVQNIGLLITPLNINQTLINSLKNKSINFLKKNLFLS